MKTMFIGLFSMVCSFGLNVRFSEMPQDYQLYPRGTDNKGTVLIQGTVLDLGKDSAVVLMMRNGVLFSRQRAALAYQGDSAEFQFLFSLPAELAEYGFECLIDAEPAASADSIVAGDVYFINGQSNAATYIDGCEWLEYARDVRLADSSWGLGKSGAWGQILARQIIQNHHIPVCIFNGGVWAAPISWLQRNNSTPYLGPYGDLLSKAFLGKVQNSIKAVFWYQGESDAGYGADTIYPPQFDRLLQSWIMDYPGLIKVYMMQINIWKSNGSREMRETQRQLAHQYGAIEIMTTIGAPGYDGHGGWNELGANLYRLIDRDFYGSRDTAGITPPEIQRAYYTSASKDKIALEFDQPVYWNAKKDTVVYLNEKEALVPGYLKDYFAMDDSIWESVDSCWFEMGNRRIVLDLKTGMQPTTISYMPDWYSQRGCDAWFGPVLWNARHVAALTFARFPVQDPAVYDTGAITGFHLEAPKQTISIFERLPLYGIAEYAGGILDTNHYVTFTTPDTFLVRFGPNGSLRGMNPGIARVIAGKGGYLDTLLVTVDNGFAVMDSMGFSPSEKTIMAGDSGAVDLLGYFPDGVYLLDTLAAFQHDAGVLQIENGMIKTVGTSDSTQVTALFAGQRCTLQVKIPALPSFVRRINFQPKGDSITAIPGWSIDSGDVYSSAKGFGWTTSGAGGMHTPLIANYFKATFAWNPGEYQVDCPDGNYLIRLCVCVKSWQEPGFVRQGDDTLVLNPQTHDSYGTTSDAQIWLSDKRISVSGGAGLRLYVYGGISYLVLISDDGADLNLAAKDGNFSPDPLYTEREGKKGAIYVSLLRKPIACPNPFNPSTTVRFGLPAGVSADYVLYDIRGRKVFSEKLVGARMPQIREVALDFNQPAGPGLASGAYFGRLVCSDGKRYVHSLVMIR